MINLFDKITLEDKNSILRELEATSFRFPEGVSVFNREQKDNVGFIEEGFVQIIRNDYNGDRIIIDELRKGDVFGTRISSITTDDYDVVSVSPCRITFFEFSKLYKNSIRQCRGYIDLQENIIRLMGEIVEARNERIQVLSKKTIRERLLEYFLISEKKQKSKRITLPFNYTELADYLAINRSAMYRELQNLKEERIITIQKKVVTLLYDKEL